MTDRPFDVHAPLQAPPSMPPGPACKEQALIELLQHGMLSHTFGANGEYEVRTTLSFHPTWRYRCSICRDGKAMTSAFLPIVSDRAPPRRQRLFPDPEGTNAMRRNFASEAVDVHLTRCAALQDYLTMSAIYAQPPPASRRRYTFLALVIGAVVLLSYGFWGTGLGTDRKPPVGDTSPPIQEVQPAVVDHQLPEAPAPAPQHAVSGAVDAGIMAGPNGALSQTPEIEQPKAVHPTDHHPLPPPPERADSSTPAFVSQAPSEPTAPEVQAHDLLHLTGWIHRIFRDPDDTYRLQISADREGGTPDLLAFVPPPNQGAGAPAVRAQLQTVRDFIRRRLLRGQEPSPRGSAMRHPVFVLLTGQLSNPRHPSAVPREAKSPPAPMSQWQLRPVLEIEFAPPPTSTNRSRRN